MVVKLTVSHKLTHVNVNVKFGYLTLATPLVTLHLELQSYRNSYLIQKIYLINSVITILSLVIQTSLLLVHFSSF